MNPKELRAGDAAAVAKGIMEILEIPVDQEIYLLVCALVNALNRIAVLEDRVRILEGRIKPADIPDLQQILDELATEFATATIGCDTWKSRKEICLFIRNWKPKGDKSLDEQ